MLLIGQQMWRREGLPSRRDVKLHGDEDGGMLRHGRRGTYSERHSEKEGKERIRGITEEI